MTERLPVTSCSISLPPYCSYIKVSNSDRTRDITWRKEALITNHHPASQSATLPPNSPVNGYTPEPQLHWKKNITGNTNCPILLTRINMSQRQDTTSPFCYLPYSEGWQHRGQSISTYFCFSTALFSATELPCHSAEINYLSWWTDLTRCRPAWRYEQVWCQEDRLQVPPAKRKKHK